MLRMISTSQLSFNKTAIFVASSAITVWVLTGCANFGSSNSNTNPSVAPPGMSSSVTSATKPDAVIIKNSAKWADEQRKSCDKYYPGAIQAGIRRSCYVGGALVDRYNGWAPRVSESGCRLQYGEEPTETYACLIGTKIANQLANTQTKDALEKQGGQKPFLASLQSCSEIYSVRTDLDTYLLESCLTGIHANSFMPNLDRFEICRQITPERSFIGPCSVGASLNSSDSTPTSDHRIQCEKYFDHLRFHQAYRSCLNAKAVNPENDDAITLDAIKARCDTIVSDNGNDHERGACIIGAVLLENKRRGLSSSIFDGCGVNQVRYEDRDVLGCLAAGSFLSYSNSNTADRLCREIFRDRKSLARSGCLNSISALKAAPVNPNSTKQ
jgi:hypothetical protein